MTRLLLPLLLALTPAFAQSGEEPVRELIARYAAAREAMDPARVSALFTPDADQLVSSGEWRRGREALVQGAMASSRQNEGRRTLSVEGIRFLSPAIAIVDARYEIAGESGTRRMWSTFIVHLSSGGWRIAAIRNMLPAPR